MNSIIAKSTIPNKLDLVGAFLSLACAAHCMAIPFLVAVLPMVGLSFFLNATVERVFVIASISLAAFSMCWGYRIHKRIRTLLIFSAAAVMIISGMFILPHTHHIHESHTASQPIHHAHTHAPHGHRQAAISVSTANYERPQDNPLGLLLLVIGGTVIAISHLLNQRLCRSCQQCHSFSFEKDCRLYL